MASEAVIKIKGDVNDFIKSLDETQRKMVEVGKHAEKNTHHAKSFGEAWEHANTYMARQVVHALSLGGALKESLNVLKEYEERSEKAAKDLDDLRLKRAYAAEKLGISEERAEALTGAGSSVSPERLVGFLGELSKQGSRATARGAGGASAGRVIGASEAETALGLLRTGLFDDDEVLRAARRGQLGTLQSHAKDVAAHLSPEARSIMESRAKVGVYEEQVKESDAVGGRGFGERYEYGKAALARHGGLANLPGLREFFAFSSALQGLSADNPTHAPDWLQHIGDDATESRRRAESHPAVEELKKQTAILAKPETPTVSPGVH